MSGFPFTVCTNCGQIDFFKEIALGPSTIIAGSVLMQNCSRCKHNSISPKGDSFGNEQGILFQPFGLTVDDMRVAFEIVQNFPADHEFSTQERHLADAKFKNRTRTNKKPFTDMFRWSNNKKLKQQLKAFALIVIAVSGIAGNLFPYYVWYLDEQDRKTLEELTARVLEREAFLNPLS